MTLYIIFWFAYRMAGAQRNIQQLQQNLAMERDHYRQQRNRFRTSKYFLSFWSAFWISIPEISWSKSMKSKVYKYIAFRMADQPETIAQICLTIIKVCKKRKHENFFKAKTSVLQVQTFAFSDESTVIGTKKDNYKEEKPKWTFGGYAYVRTRKYIQILSYWTTNIRERFHLKIYNLTNENTRLRRDRNRFRT